jgi:ubiquinone/menaquinone biosynthesis C-methylase UbiE
MPEFDLNKIYESLWGAHGEGPFAELDRSLSPRSGDLLYELAGDLGLSAGASVLDAGCGRGVHALELGARFGWQVTGIDLVRRNTLSARRRIKEAGLQSRVRIAQGAIEALSFVDDVFDLLWCRDMLVHVNPLETALVECARVLRPGGYMLTFNSLASEQLATQEAWDLFGPLGIQPRNLDAGVLEAAISAAGFDVVERLDVGSEFIEYIEEKDGRYGRELRRIARMLRQPERFKTLLGEDVYELSLGLYRWGIYHLLGKLEAVVHILRLP